MIRILLALGALVGLAAPAQALTLEYYAYNSYGPLESVLTMTALIFSDQSFYKLAGIIGSLGLFISLMHAALIGVYTGNFSMVGAYKALTGTALFVAFTASTGSLIVNDRVLNKTREFTGIPDIVVGFLGATNMVERAIIEIIDTTIINPNMQYRNGAGGIGFDLLNNAISGANSAPSALTQLTLDRYVNECLMFELARPGSTVSYDDVVKNDNWIPVLAEAANPAIWTQVYSAANKEGLAMTCAEAWPSVQADLQNPSTYEEIRKNACKKAGINADDAAEYQKCKSIMESHIQMVGKRAQAMPSIDFLRQAHMANTMNNYLMQGGDAAAMAMANRNLMTSGISTMLVANEYMPIIRGVITSMSIAMIPMVFLLFPTSVVGKAVQLLLGFFVFLMFWSILDALTHAVIMNHAINYFAEIASNNTGYAAVINMPSASGKALGAFAVVRTISVSFATMFAGIVGLSSGSVMAGMIGQMQAPVSQGASAAAQTATVEGRGKALSDIEQHYGNVTVAGMAPLEQRANAQTATRMAGIAKGGEMAKNMDGHMDMAASEANANLATHKAEGKAAQAMGFKDLASAKGSAAGENLHEQLATHKAEGQAAKQAGFKNRAAAKAEAASSNLSASLGARAGEQKAWGQLGLNSEYEISRFKNSGGIVDAKMEEQAQKHGMKGIMAGMKLEDFSVGKNGEAMAKGSMALDSENIDKARELMRANGGDFAADVLHEGQMMKFDMNAKTGLGELDATQASRSKTGDHASDVQSRKEIFQDTQERDTSRSSKAGLHTDGASVMQQALKGDPAFNQAILDKDGNIDKAAVIAQDDAMASWVQQMGSKHSGTAKGAGLEGKASWATNKNFAGSLAERVSGWSGGFDAKAYANSTSEEQHNMIRSMFRAEDRKLEKDHTNENGILDKQAYMEARQNFFKEKLEGLDDRSASRTENSALGNVRDDGSEVIKGIGADLENMVPEGLKKMIP